MGNIKLVPRTGHRARSLPPSPAGERAEAPVSYLPPASRLRDQRRSSGRGRPSRTEIPTSSLRRRSGTRVAPGINTPRPPSATQQLPSPVLPGGSGSGRCCAGGRRFGAALAGWECEEEIKQRRRDSARSRAPKRALVYRFIHIIYIYVAFFLSTLINAHSHR